MGFFKLGTMTLRGVFGKPVTRMYPQTKREPFLRTKGHVVNDIETCISCGICERTCPTHAIKVDKADRTWSIHPFDCIQCTSCVRACPKQCLSMDARYTEASTMKQIHLYRKHPLSKVEIEERARKEAERVERIAQAKAAAEAKKADETPRG
jgi:ech hydrogenase subunit F